MRLKEFLYESKNGGYLIKNNLTYLPLETWIRQETGEDPNSSSDDTEINEEKSEDEDENDDDAKTYGDMFSKKNNVSPVSDKSVSDYATRVKADQVARRSKDKSDNRQQDYIDIKNQWDDMPAPRDAKKRKTDYKSIPFIHGSSITFIANGHEIDVESLKNIIKTRPVNLLKQNEKMEHSASGNEIYFNVGLPALRGIAVNEATNQFVYVNTCPGAGDCVDICYAKKGNYVIYPANWEKSSKTLNFLLNDPVGFRDAICAEIQQQVDKWDPVEGSPAHQRIMKWKANKEKKLKSEVELPTTYKVVVRWHDAGDFFSPEYLKIAFDIAKRFPNVDFYCYTKMVNVLSAQKPDNFIANWSEGANQKQRELLDKYVKMFGIRLKKSIIVPEAAFDKYTYYKKEEAPVSNKKEKLKTTTTLEWNNEASLKAFKRDIAMTYGVEPDTIVTWDQLNGIEKGTIPKWNVIVKPGDGDSAANRRDVDGVFLLFH